MIPPIVIYTGVSVVASMIGAMVSRRRMRELVDQIAAIRSETDAAVTKTGTKVVEIGTAVANLSELTEKIVEQVNWLSTQQGQTATAINGLVDKVGGVEKLRRAAHAAMPGTTAFNSLAPVDALTAAGFKPPASGPVDGTDDDDDDDGDGETAEDFDDENDWVAKREAMQV